MIKRMKKIVFNLRRQSYEPIKVLKLIESFSTKKSRILDVGCGYGRFLKPLHDYGYNILGIDYNSEIVALNTTEGYKCLSVNDFKNSDVGSFDLIVLSHLIEHFNHDDLLKFIDYYISLLNKDGYLLIYTPVFNSTFYNDFDHVKPYTHMGIDQIWGAGEHQIYKKSIYTLKVEEIMFFKMPIKFNFVRGKFIKSWTSPVIFLIETCMILLFIVSFRKLGTLSSWTGIYKKI